jgi:NAD(P)H-dependent FMN reductase
MKVLIVNGDPKAGGFIGGALTIVSGYLSARGVEAREVRLHELDIRDCIGCFNCLKTGHCVLKDDMEFVIPQLLEADGFVIGSPVRNGLTTACFKRFYERITYPLGFPLLLEDKYVLAISCVGYMGGKRINKRHLGLQDVFHSRLVDYLFFKVGVPTRIDPGIAKSRLEKGAGRLLAHMEARPPRPLVRRLLFAVDRAVMGRFVFGPNPGTYASVVEVWKGKGYL